jgi:hypothetical protein
MRLWNVNINSVNVVMTNNLKTDYVLPVLAQNSLMVLLEMLDVKADLNKYQLLRILLSHKMFVNVKRIGSG